MVNLNLKSILIILGAFYLIAGVVAINKNQSNTIMNREAIEKIQISNKNENLVNYLLNENTKEQFSFIQEESKKFGASYLSLIEQLSNEAKSNSVRKLQENNSTLAYPNVNLVKVLKESEMEVVMLRNIMIWLPIGLVILLYFVLMSLAYMPIQKNSMLYAKYGTTKQLQGGQ